MKNKEKKIREWILRLVYPHTCPFCGRVTKDEVCFSCRETVYKIQEPFCRKCGKPLSDEAKEYCGDCEQKRYWFDQGRALWLHEKKVLWSVYQFKFRNRRIYGRYYASELAEEYGELMKKWQIALLVPVPLNSRKKRTRGYNQAEILARCLSEKLGIPADRKSLVRSRDTKPQMTLDPVLRRENVRGAFVWKGGSLDGKNILLLDDIYTTGSTIDSASRELKKAGAQKVYFLTISIGQGN